MKSMFKIQAECLQWKSIYCPKTELSLDFTLEGGQSFRWQKMQLGVWRGVFAGKIWMLSQDDNLLHYASFPSTVGEEDLLADYFQLKTMLGSLYEEWSNRDAHFAKLAHQYRGVRVLRQDPVENLFSFLCSSNNNISRITGMVNSLCSMYGDVIGELDGCVCHSFPSVQQLATKETERQLKALKFGYRAAFVAKTAQLIAETKGSNWLHDLRDVPYTEAQAALMQLPGVGRKVADCICLMSLDKTQSVPVDTHIFQVATKSYLHQLKPKKAVTAKVYREIGDHFRTVFGNHAGWAHSVLFTSDLAKFKQPKQEETVIGKDSSARQNRISGEKSETQCRKKKKIVNS